MKKKEILDHREALLIIAYVAKMVEDLKINGTVVIVDRGGVILACVQCGESRPMTFDIALNKARQAAFTGARTRDIAESVKHGERTKGLYGLDPERFVPFPGGCPIYSKGGKQLGGAGFSEQTGDVDERIISVALEECGFKSSTPTMKDISLERIEKTAEDIAVEPVV